MAFHFKFFVAAYRSFTPSPLWMTLVPPVLPRLLANEVSRDFFFGYRHRLLRRKTFTSSTSSVTRYCWVKLSLIAQYSSTAASKWSPDFVSVPVWLIFLPKQLSIIGFVGLYPTKNPKTPRTLPTTINLFFKEKFPKVITDFITDRQITVFPVCRNCWFNFLVLLTSSPLNLFLITFDLHV